MTMDERTDGRLSVVEARLDIISRDVASMRIKIDEQTGINAERRVMLADITASLAELKTTTAATSAAVQGLTLGSGIMKQKVAWLIAVLLFVANFLGQGAGSVVRQALAAAGPPPVSSDSHK